VAFGDGTFVTASWISRNLAYSSDGINWTEVAHPTPSDYESSKPHGIDYGNGRCVIVGSYFPPGNSLGKGITLYSTNGGASWYEGSGDIVDSARVAYGDGVFVAAGFFAGLTYSPDGIVWTKASSSSSPLSSMNDVAFGGE
jgi:hypothetical protein